MLTHQNSSSHYQVGGSLPFNASTYVQRQADEALFQGILQGEFCYVFNARQMGKSSLRVHTTYRLKTAGVRCGVIDITAIGTQEITSEQWYASIIGLLVKAFQLKLNLFNWWKEHSHLSFINRLSEFLETILLAQVSEPIVIFIDEIDSVLSLNFSTDDFFALIRACYNRRAENPDYNRLTFALFGVATPADLISDTTRTPFNVGKAIELKGFQLSESMPLLGGLSTIISESKIALSRILDWTNGQPFLTQKLCLLAVRQGKNKTTDSTCQFIDDLVEHYILKNWETQDEPEHLKTIRDRLLYSEERVGRLLGLYQQILLRLSDDTLSSNHHGIVADNSAEQTELILSGLVEKRDGILHVKNPIYQHIFNLDWVAKQLSNLRPYSQSINAWIVSGYQDESWLLRGNALRDVLAWSQGKSLSDLDYQFLATSQELDRHEAQKTLEAERFKEVEARLELERQRSLEQRHHLRRQRVMLGVVSGVMVVAIALGLFAYHQYQKTALSELRAITLSSEALFASNKWFNALLQAIKAKERSSKLANIDNSLQAKVDIALWRVVLSIQESNRLNGHTAAVLGVDFSPDGTLIATTGIDSTVKLWRRDGSLIKTLKGHQGILRCVKFSPDGELIASGGDDKTIKLWKRDGTLLRTIPIHTSGVWGLDFSPDSTALMVAGSDSPVEMWGRDGTLLKTFEGQQTGIRAVAFRPDGQAIASANTDNTINIWSLDGRLQQVLQGHPAAVYSLAYSPDSEILVSGSADGIIQLWDRQGNVLKTLAAHDANVKELRFSPDGQRFASGSWDKTVKVWKQDGTLLTTLRGHDAAIWGIAFSPDSQEIASGGAENVVILWKSQNSFQKTIYGLKGLIRGLAFAEDGNMIATSGTEKTLELRYLDGTLFKVVNAHDAALSYLESSPDGKILASASEDKTIKLWRPDGTLLRTFKEHPTTVLSVTWHPQGQLLATSTADGKIFLWQRDGKLLKTFAANPEGIAIWDVKFSPDGQLLAAASNDKTLTLWNLEGKRLKVLQGHNAAIWRVTFSPDSEIIASGSGDMTVKLWSRDGMLLKTLTGHTAAVWGIAFSRDGSLIATSSIDETVKLWTPEGVLLNTLKGHQSGLRAVAFHPHRPILASVGDDQKIILWSLDQILNLDPLSFACHWVQNYLATNPTISPDDAQLCQEKI